MKRTLIILFFIIYTISVNAQAPSTGDNSKVKWCTIQEAEKLNQKSPRLMFIDTYTDWCGWCKKMDKDTFTNPVIAEILNTKFYPVKFDAEGKESVTFLGRTYINDGKYGNANQLAVALLNGQLSYPTVVFLGVNIGGKTQITQVPGYKDPKDMEVLLSFFADKAYLTQKWEDFQKNFKGKVQ